MPHARPLGRRQLPIETEIGGALTTSIPSITAGVSITANPAPSTPTSLSQSAEPSDGAGSVPNSEPPASQPPNSQPPSSQPPSSQPPSSQPPASQPPSSQPPASQQPSSQPPQPPHSSQPPASSQAPSHPPSSLPPASSNDPSSDHSSAPLVTSANTTDPTPTPTGDVGSTPSLTGSTTMSYETTITSTFVFTSGGKLHTSTTIIPTNLSDKPSSGNGDTTTRNAAIGGALGGATILFALLACLFLWRRKKLHASLALFSRQPKSRTALLAEEFDTDDDLSRPSMRRYSDHPSIAHPHGSTPSLGSYPSPYGHIPPVSISAVPASPPRLMRSRASESGSVFHEDVWPPPGESSRLVDPLIAGASAVDLHSVVSDIMGPSPADGSPSSPAVTFARGPHHTREHTRDSSISSVGSQSGLLPKQPSPLATPTTPTSAVPSVAGSSSPSKVMWLDRKDARRSGDLSAVSSAK